MSRLRHQIIAPPTRRTARVTNIPATSGHWLWGAWPYSATASPAGAGPAGAGASGGAAAAVVGV